MTFPIGMAALAVIIMADAAPLSGAQAPATVTAAASPMSVARGGKGTLVLTLSVRPHYVVTAHQEKDPDAVIATVIPVPATGIAYGPVQYPAPHKVSIGGQPELAYTGRARIIIPFTVTRAAKAGRARVGGAVTYQGCSQANGTCLPPSTQTLFASVAVR